MSSLLERACPEILYGVAYYREYMPYERLDEDIAMMREAGINIVRIGESTWSTYEKEEGHFDFSPVLTVLDKMHAAGIKVIVGTPTYAVPGWLVRRYPEVMVTTAKGQERYGGRQKMDITHPAFLFYADRIITKMMEAVHDHPAIIGYQLDNETKYYGTCADNIQRGFLKYLKEKFKGDLNALNHEFGLDYWSNRIDAWEDFPDVVYTINGSLGAEFQRYQRSLVTDYLEHQASLVHPFLREGQFLTHNFDFEWRKISFGLQPDVDHFASSKAVDIMGVDIYHPSQYELTGHEIGFGGDLARSMKDLGYFVLETQAQGFKQWTPLPSQLKLQALSHVASGARMVEYWHWHSIHNSYETYWKGVLSHDLQKGPTYYEVKDTAAALKQISPYVQGMHKKNKVCLVVSNEALTAIDYFPFEGHQFDRTEHHQYNDLMRRYYDALFDANVEVDVHDVYDDRIFNYELLVIPALYAVSDERLERINDFVRQGGNILVSLRSGVANEHVKVRTTLQPGILSEVLGCHYQLISATDNGAKLQFTDKLTQDHKFSPEDSIITDFIELVQPYTKPQAPTATDQAATPSCEVLAYFDDEALRHSAAITFNADPATAGKGSSSYIACNCDTKVIQAVVDYIAQKKQLQLTSLGTKAHAPVIVRTAYNAKGEHLAFVLNYSAKAQQFELPCAANSLLTPDSYEIGSKIELQPWGAAVLKLAN